jgi:succinate dehydrogenase / fumarate reductase, cytochrome b subunit
MNYKAPALPQHFLWRRFHSLMGIWLVIFLCEHLLTNSQAALSLGLEGTGFIKMVNFIQGLPFLPVIEVVLLGAPFVIHAIWGVMYLRQAKLNSLPCDGSTPNMSQYSANHRYSWQRVTSWILLLGIILHVVHMRFLEIPQDIGNGISKRFLVELSFDDELYSLSPRFGFSLFDEKRIQEEKWLLEDSLHGEVILKEGVTQDLITQKSKDHYSLRKDSLAIEDYQINELEELVEALDGYSLEQGKIIAISSDFGTAMLLVVRDTFKNPWMVALYTLFVLAACYHAMNGLWSFLISWGISVTERSQAFILKVCVVLGITLSVLGLVAIFGSYGILSH